MQMMEMGNSISSLPCIINKNERSSATANAVIDVIISNSSSDKIEEQTHANMLATSSHREDIIHNDSIHVKWSKAVKKIFQVLEEFMFPKSLLLNSNIHPRLQHQISSRNTVAQAVNSTMKHNHSLLRRCKSLQEQHAYIKKLLESCQHLQGRDGLLALGFEYRLIPCDEHKSNDSDVDLSCSAVDTVPSNDIVCNGDDLPEKVYLSERALQHVETLAIEDEKDTFEQEGQVILVELAKVKSEKYLNLSNRSDSILSDDGSSTNHYIASHNADICTTPSLATTFTAVVPTGDEDSSIEDHDDIDGDDGDNEFVGHGVNTKVTTVRKDSNNSSPTVTAPGAVVYKHPTKKIVHQFCHLCERRLYDIVTDTCITDQNRSEYIANGEMYELVSRFVQEYAHEIMIQEGNLTWINIEDDNADIHTNTASSGGSNNNSTEHDTQRKTTESTRINGTNETRPIRCLISKDHPCLMNKSGGATHDNNHEHDGSDKDPRPTLLICTGRGKVRAGIFSRHHLICTGLERSTALPFIHEAIHRNIHVVLFDPNVHGETHGFTTFTKSMNFLQSYYDHHVKVPDDKNESMNPTSNNIESNVESIPNNPFCRDMYILSHSASGGHLVRYFLDKCQTPYIRNIRAIAFTDSTHSVQWAKGTHQTYLYDLLQSLSCIYFRCSASTRDTIAGDGDSKWYLHPAGEVVQTDSFWRHRFGSVRTVWAGTNEHSQTNWFAHAKIWEHFDQFLFS
jgi:hypothetical protein